MTAIIGKLSADKKVLALPRFTTFLGGAGYGLVLLACFRIFIPALF